MPCPYDAVAPVYDQHFRRRVDEWEDERLAELMRPWVDGASVVDLGCGTGWVLDHLEPNKYLGLDASAPMLAELRSKHPDAHVVQAYVGTPGWADLLVSLRASTVVATWAAHEMHPLHQLLTEVRSHLGRGVSVLLHGQAPRYASRDHYVLDGTDPTKGYLRFTPEACESAGRTANMEFHGCTGVGAFPDRFARTRLLWRVGLLAPARHHYSFLARYTT